MCTTLPLRILSCPYVPFNIASRPPYVTEDFIKCTLRYNSTVHVLAKFTVRPCHLYHAHTTSKPRHTYVLIMSLGISITTRSIYPLASVIFKVMETHRHNVLVLHASNGCQQMHDDQLALLVMRRQLRRMQHRSCWVHHWLHAERRLLYGHYDRLLAEMRMED